jgi:DNA topoisomerase-1
VKSGEETRSLPAELSPLDITLEKAQELLAQPKAARRGFGAKKEPLKVFAESPITGNKVQLLDGRYGLYVSDGVTNASLPKGTAPEDVTLEGALVLLAERAAAGPPKKGARKGAKKKAAKPAAVKTKAKAAVKKATKAAKGATGAKTKKASKAKEKPEQADDEAPF